jgi:hypothetical protein
MSRKTDEAVHAATRRLTDEHGLVKYVNGAFSLGYVRAGRSRGVLGNGTPPPPHLKIGSRVLYDLDEVDCWLDERRVQPGKGKAHKVPRAQAARRAEEGAA